MSEIEDHELRSLSPLRGAECQSDADDDLVDAGDVARPERWRQGPRDGRVVPEFTRELAYGVAAAVLGRPEVQWDGHVALAEEDGAGGFGADDVVGADVGEVGEVELEGGKGDVLGASVEAGDEDAEREILVRCEDWGLGQAHLDTDEGGALRLRVDGGFGFGRGRGEKAALAFDVW